MLTLTVIHDVITFFVIKKCQKIQKIDENSYYSRRKSSYLLNDLGNSNEIFRKDFTHSLADTLFEKPQVLEFFLSIFQKVSVSVVNWVFLNAVSHFIGGEGEGGCVWTNQIQEVWEEYPNGNWILMTHGDLITAFKIPVWFIHLSFVIFLFSFFT